MAQLIRPNPLMKGELTSVKMYTSPTQSQELVQSFISASFGCLTFLRGLFAENNYSDKRIALKNNPSSREFVRLKLLKRGVSTQGDKLLDWIERGIFDALQHKYLKAIVFAIFIDSNRPDVVTEAYTFSISYRADGPASIQMVESQSGASVEIGVSSIDANTQLAQLMRSFIVLTQGLPALPQERYLTIQLLFSEDCPDDYQPPYFKDASDDVDLHFSSRGEHDIESEQVGSFTAGWHAISLKVTSTSGSDFGNFEIQSSAPSPESQTINAFAGRNGKSSVKIETLFGQIEEPKWGIPNVVTRSQEQARQHEQREMQARHQHISFCQALPEPPSQAKLEGQTDLGQAISNLFTDRVPNGTQDVQTQPLSQPASMQFTNTQPLSQVTVPQESVSDSSRKRSSTERSKSTPKSRQSTTVAKSKSKPPAPRTPATKTMKSEPKSDDRGKKLSSAKRSHKAKGRTASVLQGIENLRVSDGGTQTPSSRKPTKRSGTASQKTSRASSVGSVAISAHNTKDTIIPSQMSAGENEYGTKFTISCECGHNQQDDDFDFVECSRCKVWKHIACYGFESIQDTALELEFVCTMCRMPFLSESDMKKIRLLAMFRRSLKIIYMNIFTRQATLPMNYVNLFHEHLGGSKDQASLMLALLSHEGVLVFPQAHKRQQTRILSRVPVLVNTDSMKEQLRLKYFDATATIETVVDLVSALLRMFNECSAEPSDTGASDNVEIPDHHERKRFRAVMSSSEAEHSVPSAPEQSMLLLKTEDQRDADESCHLTDSFAMPPDTSDNRLINDSRPTRPRDIILTPEITHSTDCAAVISPESNPRKRKISVVEKAMSLSY
ncbi:HORMA domain-containing protein [Limtongia smithiae]|uniref:HORMA domain-containing protein n=1 Tax=Limtongia smithiae TaxID=1125753 RepID=UPI0034CFCB64